MIVQAPERNEEEFRGTLCDVGAGGMMLELSVEMVPGNEMRAVVQTWRGPVEVEGRVIWTRAAGAGFSPSWTSGTVIVST